MALESQFIVESLDYQQFGGPPSNASRQSVISMRSYPDVLSKGQIVTLSNGFKFRKATEHAKSLARITNESGLMAKTIRTTDNAPSRYNGSPGWFSDFTFDGNIRYSILSRASVNDIRYPPQIPSGEANEAHTKALLELAQGKAQIGENLATLRQTLRLIKDPLDPLIKSLTSVYKNKSFRPLLGLPARGVKRAVKNGFPETIASNYLKYVYGWKPLMQDIHGVIELAQSQSKNPLLINGKGSSENHYLLPDMSFDAVSYGVQYEAFELQSWSKTRASIWAMVDPEYSGVRSLNQLGLLNPLSLAWELVPWSFVVDWVCPIGPVLEALTAPVGLHFVDGSTSRRVTASGKYSVGLREVADVQIIEHMPSAGKIHYDGYYRSHDTNWPLPGFWFEDDPFGLNSDGSDRIFKASALALLALQNNRRG